MNAIAADRRRLTMARMRQAQCIAVVEAPPAPPPPMSPRWHLLHHGSDFEPMQELMTGDNRPTTIEMPRLADGDGDRARYVTLMDTMYPEDAPHYWRDYDLTFFYAESAANEPASPPVYAPLPLMADLQRMAAQPDVDHTNGWRLSMPELEGMPSWAVLSIVVLALTVMAAGAHRAGWI